MEGSQEDENSLVRVRAQVMTRDDSSGGWVPMGAGGLSLVSVCKRPVTSEEDKLEYLIYGKRIGDQTVVLSCTLKKDFQYNRVMPTFHHWRTGDKKFGLTFQTSADAKAFDKGVRTAIEDLTESYGDFPNFHDSDVGEDDVFMTLELPFDSSSGSSSFSGGSYRPPGGAPLPYPAADMGGSPFTSQTPHQPPHRMTFVRSARCPTSSLTTGNNNVSGYVMDPTVKCHRGDSTWTRSLASRDRKDHLVDIDKIIEMSGDQNSYVQLSRDKEHDYSYPIMDSYKGSLKKPPHLDAFSCQPPAPRLPVKAKRNWRRGGEGRKNLTGARAQCRHCLEMYSPEDNQRGSCEYAPDRVLRCINKASCIGCAQCLMYHCMADSEGDFNQHTCSCDTTPGEGGGHCPKRWTALTLLSIFIPCLWCYLPLRACHRCGVQCGVCGGRHDPA